MYIYFDIVSSFACEMCGVCCRNDWLITMNEQSYRRNAQLFMGTGRGEEFAKAFIPLNANVSLDEYAYIAKQNNGSCWFLADEQHCRLHREAGHEHLDIVCQTFPRYPMDTMRGTELTLSFSCPAVIKLASRMSPLTIIRSAEPPIPITPDTEVVHVYPQQQSASNPLRYYFELEQHFIDMMQCRSITINERLQMIKQTVQRIDCLPQDSMMLGQQLNKIFYDNYEFMDTKALEVESSVCSIAEALLENFFVNFIFKKPFYLYGLVRTMQLLESIWQRINTACVVSDEVVMDLGTIQSLVMEVEFQYSHHRKALFEQSL